MVQLVAEPRQFGREPRPDSKLNPHPKGKFTMSPEAQKARDEEVSTKIAWMQVQLTEAQKAFDAAEKALKKAADFLPLLEALGEPVAAWKQEIADARALAGIGESHTKRIANEAREHDATKRESAREAQSPECKPAVRRERPF